MPVYLQIVMLLAAFAVFVVLILYLGGLSVRKACFSIISEMEEARAFSASRAINIQDKRKNFFLVGTGNIRPKALNVLLADKIVIKTSDGKYYLDKEKLAQMKGQMNKSKA
jgi:hypothetical protein